MSACNVQKIVALSIFAALFPAPVPAAESPSALKKYLLPSGITKLDWLLLKTQVESFTQPVRWDDHHLINSVSLYSIPKRAFVGMTFLVNKETYNALSDDIASKVFADVVASACNILKSTIPEVDKDANVYANFVTIGSGQRVVAEFDKGKAVLAK